MSSSQQPQSGPGLGTYDTGPEGPRRKRDRTPLWAAAISAAGAILAAIIGVAAGWLHYTGPGATPQATSAASAPAPNHGGGGSPPARPEVSATSTSIPAGAVPLSTLTPLQGSAIVTASSEQIGTTTYSDSVDISCSGSPVYDVANYKTLDATVGLASDATGAAGESVTVAFLKDGASQLYGVTVSLGHPRPLSVPLQGASQLAITCNGNGSDIEPPTVTLGNGYLTPNR